MSDELPHVVTVRHHKPRPYSSTVSTACSRSAGIEPTTLATHCSMETPTTDGNLTVDGHRPLGHLAEAGSSLP
ncbi:hypothetical protein [Natrinema longum]|uniref:hypothetical protein n=1 Tax=Natrinema longum TaxID=370324 RepID=UPI001CCEA759|nr:hypothetical protein [Natrinema longum]MBZ6495177.1 hypothetical protein [Natrinema longum]